MQAKSPHTSDEPKLLQAVSHNSQLWQGRFSPCGKYFLASGYDGLVHRWRVSGETFTALSPFAGHNGWVQCLEFSRDAEHAFSADSWGRLSCWTYADESPRTIWTHADALPGWIRCLSMSPAGRQIAVAGNADAVRVWSALDGGLQQDLDGHPDDVFSVCFHPDGRDLVTGDWKGRIRHWDVASGRLVRMLDASALYRLDRIQDCGGARVLAFDRFGKILVCGGQKDPVGTFASAAPLALLFDWKSGEPEHAFQVGEDDDGFVYAAEFHPRGFLMTTSSAVPGKGHLWFWNLGDPKPFYVNKDVANGRSLSLHTEGRLLAVVTSDSKNHNGRQVKDGEYVGGSARIHILRFPEEP